MDKYEYKTLDTALSTAKFWLEAGWYTPEDLQKVIDFKAAQDKQLRESMESLFKEKNGD